jgi:RNA polymerase sigma-70 factor (ECF subfamily)
MSNQEKYKNFSDKEVIAEIKKGNKALFDVLYERYADKVFYKALGLTKDRNIAKDLAHDIMIKLFLNLTKYKGTAPFSLWVHSISYNHCIDYLRRKKKMTYMDFESDETYQIKDDNSELEFKKVKELQLEQLEFYMEKLSTDDRMILMMFYMDELSIKQVSKLLNIGESAVKMRLMRARKRLAELCK